jgi:hypothetical protein
LAKSCADAGYFKRNLRAIEVLLDQGVVRNGRAASDEEVAAVDDGVAAMDRLLKSLVDVPTPCGKTPGEIQSVNLVDDVAVR